jgi:signal transduction histidine kinase
MKSPASLVSAPQDPKGRLVSIFVGAVMLPSIALSALTFNSVPKHAEVLRLTLLKHAESLLEWAEKDLERAAQARALEAARVVGTERLLLGSREQIQAALKKGGLADAFDSIRLEASSPVAGLSAVLDSRQRDRDILKEALEAGELPAGPEADDSLPLTAPGGERIGILRFRLACQFAHRAIVRHFFEHEFENPQTAWVIRVTEPDGTLLYENAPTPDDRFEVRRLLSAPSFRGLWLSLRQKDRSIDQVVQRWTLNKMALIGFIDVMLGAGLLLVYANVRRELQLSRLKSDFVANVSHELKTPLALIRLFAETLELGRVKDEAKAQQYYRVINKESQRLSQLINNVLDFSRIEAGRRQYRFAPTSVARVVSDVVDAHRFQIEQHGFVLELDMAEELPELPLDKEALGQALSNLVNNAIKYSREEKRIRIAVRVEADRLLLSVADRGIGIAKSEQGKIFDQFYRAEDSLVHDTKGSGLGLALVRHIMEAHGGSVEVDSSPGKGSTFTLALPVGKRA